jgi:hypothetical protein
VAGCAQSLTGKEIPLFVGDVWCATRWQRRTPVRFSASLPGSDAAFCALLSDYEFLSAAFTEFSPTAAVHFGEQRRRVPRFGFAALPCPPPGILR